MAEQSTNPENESSSPKLSPKNILSFVQKHYAILAVLLIDAILLVIFFMHISSYTQLPSPLFGGDNYRDRGFVKNIAAGNPFWSDAFYVNEVQYYAYLIPAIQAAFIKITGADLDKTFLFFPLLTLILSSLIWYFLGARLFKNKKWGMLTSAAFLFLVYRISPAFASVAHYVLFPAFLFFWLRYEQEDKKRDAALAGLFLGLLSLTYGGAFLGAFMMIVLFVAFKFIFDAVKSKILISTSTAYLKKYYLIFLIGILISMIFFMPLIIKYNFHSVNKVTEWGDEKIELVGPVWVLKQFKNIFFNSATTFTLLAGIICFAGLLTLLAAKKTKEVTFVLLIILANAFTLQQHLIMRPLFGFTFFSPKMLYLPYFAPLLLVFGAMTISQLLRKDIFKKIFMILVLLILIMSFYNQYSAFRDDMWVKVGFQDNAYIRSFYGLADFIERNVQKDEAILSNDESGFMLAVLSGRKVMITRRTHASYFIDIDKRIADAAVAMYGSNLNLSKKILKQYNVKYFYADPNLLQNTLRVRTDLKEYLAKNKINFTEAYDRYDIAVPLERANAQNLLIIPPQIINPEFLDLWNEEYAVEFGGNKIGTLYKLKEED